MIYPETFEEKIGFKEIRTMLRGYCLSSLGKERVEEIHFSTDVAEINEWMEQIREFRMLQGSGKSMPMQFFFDVREAVARLRIEGTHLEESELYDLQRSLTTINDIVVFIRNEEELDLSALRRVTEDIVTFPDLIRRIGQILDKFGRIRDDASPELARIRKELARAEGSVSRTLWNILRGAQSEGLVEKDVTPTLRDGRLVIPVSPGMKRKIQGIVHDESATGKTVFIEPTEVVEANNRIRELEAAERQEVIRILTEFSKEVRPHIGEITASYSLLATIDMIRAKAEMAEHIGGIELQVEDTPLIDWTQAKHPLLMMSLRKQGKDVVALDIELRGERREERGERNVGRILIISGPNAGGKSVCLKTTGLLQYMIQCGLSVPMSERSHAGVFRNILMDIGDEQSLENDLSTYSSHLLNMKNMIRVADENTLILIDEFGTGTEPQIGGAIAESVLKQFWNQKTLAVITTHYQNLKHFAEDHEGVVNGAMLYDRHEMRPLFQLETGRPGSSFAIDIARKIGLPEVVINDATEIVGSEYIQSDKYLQDIVRDKRYWESKRQAIHQHEKTMQQTIARYEEKMHEIESERKKIIKSAKEQAEELLRESNRQIENTIREIRESQAEKEITQIVREELREFEKHVTGLEGGLMSDDDFNKKLRQIEERKKRKEKRKEEKKDSRGREGASVRGYEKSNEAKHDGDDVTIGATVRMKGLTTVGKIEAIDGKTATVIFGDVRTRVKTDRLEVAEAPKEKAVPMGRISKLAREAIDNRKLNFHQDLDIRGMRGDEALNEVMHFIDDAILVGMSPVRILHGKGNGILRQLIRDYLSTVPNVTRFRDEHVQFGGAGITVVEL
ncbi:MAG: Smr/MutS family protein [Prevotella sp.]|nr:Smr/MutS family protein [Prevotella sp.]